MSHLPLQPDDLGPTRDYLQDVAKVMGSLQRAFVPANAHGWQHGLEVVMRGLRTQPFTIAGQESWALLDLVRHQLRVGGASWRLGDYDGPQLLQAVQDWLAAQGVGMQLEKPVFTGDAKRFAAAQADAYATALWWVDAHFRRLVAGLHEGLVSPILLYPHHFDLALAWFPWGDDRQLNTGFSLGDSSVAEPYLYVTAYPEPKGFTRLQLPAGAAWQATGFSGAMLPYAALQAAPQPAALIKEFTAGTFAAARQLL